jgi:hypothetical protein
MTKTTGPLFGVALSYPLVAAALVVVLSFTYQARERPLVAVSGLQNPLFSTSQNVRFGEKRTLSTNLAKSGHQKGRFTPGSGH